MIKKIKEDKTDFITFIVIELSLIAMIVISILYTYRTVKFNTIAYVLYGSGILSAIMYIMKLIKERKMTKFDLIMYMLILLLCISLIHPMNFQVALFGRSNRQEGFFAILSYYAIALCASKIKRQDYKKILIYTILGIGLLNGLYGLLQTGVVKMKVPFEIKQKWYYARGFTHNSMYYATLMTMCYGLIYGFFLKNKISIMRFLSLALFTFFGILSGSMAYFVTVIAINILAFLYTFKDSEDKKKKRIQIIIACLVFFSANLLFSNINEAYKHDVQDLASQTTSVSKGEVEENYGTGRIYIWKNTIPKIAEHWLTGVGPDNFLHAFKPPLIDPISKYRVDKAHNEYLQMMLCEGILAGLIYIGLLSYIWFGCSKMKMNSMMYALFCAFTGYIIQAFFSISMTRVAPFYWVIFGMLMQELTKYQKQS